jgi:hypothetical protein
MRVYALKASLAALVVAVALIGDPLPARAIECQTQAANRAGDSLHLTVHFWTDDVNEDDPNEGGGGGPESIIVDSNDGFHQEWIKHETRTFDHRATIDNVVFVGNFGGEAPDGDEFCTISVETDKSQRLTPKQKQDLTDLITLIRTQQFILAAGCGATCIFLPPPLNLECGAACALGLGAQQLLALLLEFLKNDPPDPNFTVLFDAEYTNAVCPYDRNVVPSAVYTSCDALLGRIQRLHGLARAILVSFNRASGAELAGDAFWEGQQMARAEAYEAELGTLLATYPDLAAAHLAALQAWGIPSQTFTPNDVVSVEYDILSDNYAPSFDPLAFLASLGATPDDILEVRRVAYAQDSNEVAAAGPLPDVLTAPALMAAYRQAGQTFAGNVTGLECWKAIASPSFDGAPDLPFPVTDAFGTAVPTVIRKTTAACVPAATGFRDPGLAGSAEQFEIRRTDGQRFVQRTVNLMNEAQMVPAPVVLMKEVSLLVPATFNEWYAGGSPLSQYMKCYKVKGSRPRSTAMGVNDAPGSGGSTLSLGKPTTVCIPADVDGTNPDVIHAMDGFACYKAKGADPGFGGKFWNTLREYVSNEAPWGTTLGLPLVMQIREFCYASHIQ